MSHEFDNIVSDLLQLKIFNPCQCTRDFEKFKRKWPKKGKFYSSLVGRKYSKKGYDDFLKDWSKFAMKTMKDYSFILLCLQNLEITA